MSESIGNGQCTRISVLMAWILRNVQFKSSGQRLILPATQIISQSIVSDQCARISVFLLGFLEMYNLNRLGNI